MKNKYDIIVIGGGHNGLTAANLLAKNGKKVLLVEKRKILGGLAAGEEFYPGYKTNGLLHDTSAVRNNLIKSLQLSSFGLETSAVRKDIAILSKNGECILLSPDINKTANSISNFSKKDAQSYINYRAFINKISPFVNGLLNELPPDLTNFAAKDIWALGKKGLALKCLGKKTMNELLKVAPMSVADFLNEYFETDFLKAGLASPAINASYTSPRSSFTTLNLLIWECLSNVAIIGGPQALISALEKAAINNGVEIKRDSEVENILLDENGKAKGVRIKNGEEINASIVAASCTPQTVFLGLLKPNEIEYPLEQSTLHYRSRGTTAKVNLALNKSIEFNCGSDSPIAFARTGNSLDEMEKAFDPIKYRNFSEEPILDIHLPMIDNPELAPTGHSVVSILVHFAPHHFDAGWNRDQKEKLGDTVINTLSKYQIDISNSLVKSEVLSPLDLEEKYGLTNGHIFHGEHALDQLITRPFPSCAKYETPISGLYLCGSGSHPGGGITCAPGALAAKVILKNK